MRGLRGEEDAGEERKEGLEERIRRICAEFIRTSAYRTPQLEVSNSDQRALSILHKQPNNQAATAPHSNLSLSSPHDSSLYRSILLSPPSITTFPSGFSLPLSQITVFMFFSSTIVAPFVPTFSCLPLTLSSEFVFSYHLFLSLSSLSHTLFRSVMTGCVLLCVCQ